MVIANGEKPHLERQVKVIVVVDAASADPVMLSLTRLKIRVPHVTLFQELIVVSFGQGVGVGLGKGFGVRKGFGVSSLQTRRRFVKGSGKRHCAQEGEAHDLACDDHDASSMDVGSERRIVKERLARDAKGAKR